MKKDTGTDPKGVRGKEIMAIQFDIRHGVCSLRRLAKNMLDSGAMDEKWRRACSINRKGEVGLVEANQSVEPREDVVETADTAARWVRRVDNQDPRFTVVLILLPGKANLDLEDGGTRIEKSSGGDRRTARVVALDVSESKGEKTVLCGDGRWLPPRGKETEVVFLGPFADATPQIKVNDAPIFEGAKETIRWSTRIAITPNQRLMHVDGVRIRFIGHLLVTETLIPDGMEGCRTFFICDVVIAWVTINGITNHRGGSSSVVLHC